MELSEGFGYFESGSGGGGLSMGHAWSWVAWSGLAGYLQERSLLELNT